MNTRRVTMKLQEKPYRLIVDGYKTVEIRLYDAKRQQLKIGDTIVFENMSTGDTIKTKIQDLLVFENFETLYNYFDKSVLGYKEDEEADPKDMEEYYSKEEQQEFGVIAIKIKVIQ